jgi:hypothetical protein
MRAEPRDVRTISFQAKKTPDLRIDAEEPFGDRDI